jgi:hypothetical protein
MKREQEREREGVSEMKREQEREGVREMKREQDRAREEKGSRTCWSRRKRVLPCEGGRGGAARGRGCQGRGQLHWAAGNE